MRRWLAIGLYLLLLACSGDAPISRDYPCSFTFYYDEHPTSLLFAAVRNPGSYVYVTTAGDARTSFRHVYVTSNDGKTDREDNIISTDRENYAAFRLGASNDIGLIIGMTNFNGVTAYDRSCPNCPTLQGMTFTGNRQQVQCLKCLRIYNLETGNIHEGSEGGKSLLRYYCSFDGAILHAWN